MTSLLDEFFEECTYYRDLVRLHVLEETRPKLLSRYDEEDGGQQLVPQQPSLTVREWTELMKLHYRTDYSIDFGENYDDEEVDEGDVQLTFRRDNGEDKVVSEVCLIDGQWPHLVNRGHTWECLESYLRRHHLAWMSPDAFITLERNLSVILKPFENYFTCHVSFSMNSSCLGCGCCHRVWVCSITSQEPTPVYEQLFQLIAKEPDASRVGIFRETERQYEEDPETIVLPWSAQTLSNYLNINNLQRATFQCTDFDQELCFELSNFRGELAFDFAFLVEDEQIFEQVAINQGPTGLDFFITHFVGDSMLDSLRRTQSLRRLVLDEFCFEIDIGDPDEDFTFYRLFEAVRLNRSLLVLQVGYRPATLSIENHDWIHLMQCLQEHSTLQKLTLAVDVEPDEQMVGMDDEHVSVRNAVDRLRRTHDLIDMLKTNQTLLRLEFHGNAVNNQAYKDKIQPYLTMNWYRPGLKTIMQVVDTCHRRRLLSAALTKADVRHNPTILWMFLSHFHHDFIPYLPINTKKMEKSQVNKGMNKGTTSQSKENSLNSKKRSWSASFDEEEDGPPSTSSQN